MSNLTEFGTRIKRRRLELNMTQDELARKVGYTSRSSINKIELGLVDLPQSKISAIASTLGVSPAYLLGKEEKPAEIGELAEDVIVYHRDGKTVTKKFTKEQMDMLLTMIEAIPETKKNI